jgi:septum formation protein
MTTSTAGNRRIVLASASPRRRELLAGIGARFIIDPSTVPEPERRPQEPAALYVRRAARLKAQEVASRHEDGLIIGADTIVVAKGKILGKPASRTEAARMLRSLGGGWHEVYTGVCLIEKPSCRSGSASCRSRVHMRRLHLEEIEWYLSTGEHRDKAGAYAIQGYASLFIDRIEGCYFNIVGFPIFTFDRLCRRLGLGFPGQSQIARK